jgi:predicted AAA+ superfamily ATPase
MKRSLNQQIESFLRIFPCVAVIGSRQCGKTTVVQQGRDWSYFDLEKRQDYEQIAEDPGLFLSLYSENLIIDEAQILPELFPALRVAIDDKRNQKGRYIITGSSSPELLTGISESLAGRIGVTHLSPFSYQETQGNLDLCFAQNIREQVPPKEWMEKDSPCFLKTAGSYNDVLNYWHEGGYPEPWLDNSGELREHWMEQYVQTYVYRDIARLYPALNKERFRRFIKLLASVSGNILNYSELARTLDVSQPVIKDYLDIVHHTFIWRQIPAFSRKSTKRLVKHPKGYIRDSGLLHSLLFIRRRDDLLNHIAMGHSWESMIMEQVIRQFEFACIPVELSHYRSSGGGEVDLVLEGDFGLVPIEVKFTQNVSLQKLKGLKNFIEEFNCPYGLVIHNTEEMRQLSEKIFSIPARAV